MRLVDAIKEPRFWVEVVGVVVGIAVALIYGCQLHVMQKTLEENTRNFWVDERAWLDIQTHLPDAVKEGTAMQADSGVLNKGKTVARRVRWECTVSWQRNTTSLPFDYAGDHPNTRVGLLPPTSYTTAPCFSGKEKPDILTKDQADDLLNGRAYLGVYGHGTYDDVLGKPHWFTFCNWRAYYPGFGSYYTESCTNYNDTGDGDLPAPKEPAAPKK